MDDKLVGLQSYIDRCNEAITSKNVPRTLLKRILAVYETEIKDLSKHLHRPHNAAYGTTDSNIEDAIILREQLINYAANIRSEHAKMAQELELARLKQPNVSAHAESNPTQTTTVNTTVTIEQTIKNIDELPKDVLSPEDKEALKELLYSLEGTKAAKDKRKIWDKSKNLLTVILEKGFDVAIVALPYILAAMN